MFYNYSNPIILFFHHYICTLLHNTGTALRFSLSLYYATIWNVNNWYYSHDAGKTPPFNFPALFYAGGDKLEHQKNNQIRKGWRILHQYFCLYPGGNDYGGIYLKCVPHHIRKAGNGSYFWPAGKADPVKRRHECWYRCLFSYLAAPLSEVEGLTYQVTSCGSTNRIQIGTPFYVTVTGRCYLGGFWKLNLVPIDIKANGAGVSEHYWK